MKYYCLRRSKNWGDGNQTRSLSSSMVSATQSLQKETALQSILLKHITVFQSGCWMTSHTASRCCFQELAVVPTVELCRVAQSELVSEVGECWWTDGISEGMSAGCWSWTHWSLGSALVSWLCLSAEAIAWIIQNYPPSPFFPDTIKMAASPFSLSELMYSSLHTLSLSLTRSLSHTHTHQLHGAVWCRHLNAPLLKPPNKWKSASLLKLLMDISATSSPYSLILPSEQRRLRRHSFILCCHSVTQDSLPSSQLNRCEPLVSLGHMKLPWFGFYFPLVLMGSGCSVGGGGAGLKGWGPTNTAQQSWML